MRITGLIVYLLLNCGFSFSQELILPPYPEKYPAENLSQFLTKYGGTTSQEIGTGKTHRRYQICIDPAVFAPVLPPDLKPDDKVLYCYWRVNDYTEKVVWFRQMKSGWMSFWDSGGVTLSKGASINIEF